MKKIILLGLSILLFVSCASSPFGAITRGEIKDNVYKNDSLNLTIRAPEGYTLKTNEEMNEMFKTNDKGYVEVDEGEQKYLILPQLHLSSKTNSVSLVLAVENNPNKKEKTVDDYMSMMIEEIKQSNVGQMVGVVPLDLAGKNFKNMLMRFPEDKTDHMQELLVTKEDNNFITIILSYELQDQKEAQQLLKQLKNIK